MSNRDDFEELDDYLYFNKLGIYAEPEDEDEDEDDFYRSQLVDVYGMDESDLEYLGEDDCEEIYDKLSPATSYKSTYKASATVNSVNKEVYQKPDKKKWSIWAYLGIGALAYIWLAYLTGIEFSDMGAWFVVLIVAGVVYCIRNLRD